MNWKQLNETYPQSFLEWVRVHKHDKYITRVEEFGLFTVAFGYELSGFTYAQINKMNESIWQLPEYFDALGIIITPEYNIAEKMFTCLVINNKTNEKLYIGLGYETRAEVIEIAVEYAFRIREKQLTQ